jgi:hypothetical protein
MVCVLVVFALYTSHASFLVYSQLLPEGESLGYSLRISSSVCAIRSAGSGPYSRIPSKPRNRTNLDRVCSSAYIRATRDKSNRPTMTNLSLSPPKMSDAALDDNARLQYEAEHDERFASLERDLAKQREDTNDMFSAI